MSDPNVAFTLKLRLYRNDPRTIVVKVYDDQGWDSRGAIKLTYEVRHGGKVIFPQRSTAQRACPRLVQRR